MRHFNVSSEDEQQEFEFLRFSDLDDTPVICRIDGMWARGTNLLLSAFAKAGKSTLVMHLLKALSEGSDFLGRKSLKVDGTVIYVNLELNQSLLRKFAKDTGVDLESDRLWALDQQGKAGQLRFDDPGFRKDFAGFMKDLDCEVLVIDPLSPILAMVGIDSNDTDQTRRAMEWIGEMATDADADTVIIDHTGHADKTRARNSSAKLDWTGVSWNLRAPSDETDRRRTLHVGTGRGVMPCQIEYRMDASGLLVPEDEEERLEDLLNPDTGQTVQELAGRLGVSRQAIQKKLDVLESRGIARRETRRGNKGDLWYFSSEL